MVKEMATRFEQDLLEHLRAPVEIEPCATSNSLFERLFAKAILTAPSGQTRCTPPSQPGLACCRNGESVLVDGTSMMIRTSRSRTPALVPDL